MWREWRAAGWDVAQVREGAETARRESEWQSTLRKKRGCARKGSGAVGSGVGGVRKKRGCAREGSGVVGSDVDSLRK